MHLSAIKLNNIAPAPLTQCGFEYYLIKYKSMNTIDKINLTHNLRGNANRNRQKVGHIIYNIQTS